MVKFRYTHDKVGVISGCSNNHPSEFIGKHTFPISCCVEHAFLTN